MKKLVIACLLAMVWGNTNAQKQYYKSTKDGKAVTKTSRWKDYARSQYYGLRFGVTFASGSFHHGEMNDIETSSRTGFSLGFMYGQQVASPDVPLFIETGLRYTQKGFTSSFAYDYGNGMADYQYQHNLNYLEVPVVVKYKFNTGIDDFTIQPFFGGFFELGVGSRTLRYEPDPREKYDSFSDDFFSRVDAGLRFGCGMAYQNFYFEMAYDWGMADILCKDTDRRYPMYKGFDETAHNRCFYMSIGIDF